MDMQERCSEGSAAEIKEPGGSVSVEDEYLDAVAGNLSRDSPSQSEQSDTHVNCGSIFSLLKHHGRLEASLKTISQATGPCHDSETLQALYTAVGAASVFKDFIVQTLGWDPLKSAPSSLSAVVALKVFNTLELLEMILLNLGVRDVSTTRQVNRTMYSVVTTSSKIQRFLGLRQDPESECISIFDPDSARYEPCFKRFTCDLNFRDEDFNTPTREGMLRARFKNADGWYTLSIGELPRKMLICQPPIYEVEIFAHCCSRVTKSAPNNTGSRRIPPLDKVRNVSGLTVGDLLDATKQTKEKHMLCPYAHEHHHDCNGFVKVPVEFEGILKLNHGDPCLPTSSSVVSNEEEDESIDYGYHPKPSPRDLENYMAAKRLGEKTIRLIDVLIAY